MTGEIYAFDIFSYSKSFDNSTSAMFVPTNTSDGFLFEDSSKRWGVLIMKNYLQHEIWAFVSTFYYSERLQEIIGQIKCHTRNNANLNIRNKKVYGAIPIGAANLSSSIPKNTLNCSKISLQ